MKSERMMTGTCPRCGQNYFGSPALSREDDQTLICPECGIRQALTSIGVAAEEQAEILEIIRQHTRG